MPAILVKAVERRTSLENLNGEIGNESAVKEALDFSGFTLCLAVADCGHENTYFK